MSTTWMNTSEPDAAMIGELDEVALLRAVDDWQIGTTGTVIAVSSAFVTIEIAGYLGEPLDFIEVPMDNLRLIHKCSHPDVGSARRRAIAASNRPHIPMSIGEHDVVALRLPIDGWPAGTSGTVIDVGPTHMMVEVSNHLGEDLAFLDVVPDEVRVIWRTTRRSSEIDVD